jgi:hypothetical protein
MFSQEIFTLQKSKIFTQIIVAKHGFQKLATLAFGNTSFAFGKTLELPIFLQYILRKYFVFP